MSDGEYLPDDATPFLLKSSKWRGFAERLVDAHVRTELLYVLCAKNQRAQESNPGWGMVSALQRRLSL